ncbi:MAG: CRISPR-associated endonuclease Cas2 [Thiomonas sp. 13-66-29]|jgi:CRISPR-associated protein Cas2|nr:MAG: CRISPR-associated endonuclease Cas2 [Thiomonas sp. 13-66-29]
MENLTVMAFDVASDRRRYRLTRLLLGYGHRVQESVFEFWLDNDRLDRLLTRAAAILHPEQDRLVSYALTSDDLERIQTLGCTLPTPNPDYHLL